MNLPRQRWKIAPLSSDQAALAQAVSLSPLLIQVLINRGITTPELAQIYCQPESQVLPDPLTEFPDLAKSVELLTQAIQRGEKIAICGDYDADGMTSTALLLRALKHLGADVHYAIPSRMKDGYGINERIVTEFAETGVGLILTVDNGISAHAAIALAIELGLEVIITDHHDLPETLPPADAILNPKLLAENSPYSGLAGVGVAYILAITTAQKMGKLQGLTEILLELYTLGTIADLAPLVGVNRRWLKRGLKRLPNSKLLGVQALIQLSGINDEQKALKPDDIGFRLGPRINAIGRIGDPQIVIELLTTEDSGIALERAMQCEQVNQRRQELCEQIEQEAIAYIEGEKIPWESDRVLVVIQPHWHHGVIGIVASRLVEKYGVPVFIGTEEEGGHIRGSARGIEEFNVFSALVYCQDLLGKFGGHRAAGGFSLPAENLEKFRQCLREFAHQCLLPDYLKPLIKIDAQATFADVTFDLWEQIDQLQPWGIGNEFPIFWTPQVQVLQQRIIGKNHLKLELKDSSRAASQTAIAWRWGPYYPLPSVIDIAYKLKENTFNGQTQLQLELVGVRSPEISLPVGPSKTQFTYQNRLYQCSYHPQQPELRIQNDRGKILAWQPGQPTGLLGENRVNAQTVDVTQTPYQPLITLAMTHLGQNLSV